ncbi:hypothetical protein HMF7854_01400 [Sphingomonas ginkgonis]|uniref:Uncharacterized protein n=1 Tax=Sphingomonas ginkgonis TaxID=2315330 RepID=A0A3R9YK74_9SPHN|nr:hypothetical protein [Sphingomonas ginkgonis]RST29631.1 hypothetical protein HMF7854_01400 [Sphingomonas ginkgonis]
MFKAVAAAAAIAMLAAAPAVAATKTATHTTAATKVTSHPTAAPAKTAVTTHVTQKVNGKPVKVASTGRMVTTRTATGKAVTYNCSKAGNASKKACK